MDRGLSTSWHRQALLRWVEWMLVSLGLDAEGPVAPVSRILHLAILRVLRPAESAFRRLVIVAAAGLIVAPHPVRAMPKGIVRGGASKDRVPCVPLFDPRKRFGRRRKTPRVEPRITVLGVDDWTPRPQPAPPPGLSIERLLRRILALHAALLDLPKQALRLARMQARRKPGRPHSPMRPGWPPGYRAERQHEIHEILHECCVLARGVENERVRP